MNSLRIRSNMTSALAYKNLSKTQHGLQTTLERLSSGLRINKAADDSAGSAISTRMNNQIQGMKQANENSQQANNLIQTAENSLNDISGMLSRMRELATQAATDTLNHSDRASINLEFQTLKNEISRVAHATEYNEMSLLNGTDYKNEVHRANSTADDVIGISIKNANLSNNIRKGIYTLSDQHIDVSGLADISNLSDTAITNIRYSTSSLQPALGETYTVNSQVNSGVADIHNLSSTGISQLSHSTSPIVLPGDHTISARLDASDQANISRLSGTSITEIRHDASENVQPGNHTISARLDASDQANISRLSGTSITEIRHDASENVQPGNHTISARLDASDQANISRLSGTSITEIRHDASENVQPGNHTISAHLDASDQANISRLSGTSITEIRHDASENVQPGNHIIKAKVKPGTVHVSTPSANATIQYNGTTPVGSYLFDVTVNPNTSNVEKIATFDDITSWFKVENLARGLYGPLHGPAPTDAYHGLNWDSQSHSGTYVLNTELYNNNTSGYQTVVTSGNNVAYNAWDSSPIRISAVNSETFSVVGGYWASAWDDSQNLTFKAYSNGVQKHTDTFTIYRNGKTWLALDYQDIDVLEITNSGSHWALDDFTIAEETSGPAATATFTITTPNEVKTVTHDLINEPKITAFPDLGMEIDISDVKKFAEELASPKSFTVNPTLEVTPPSGSNDAIEQEYTLASNSVNFSGLGITVNSSNAQIMTTALLNSSKEFTIDTRLTTTAPDGTHQEIKYSSGSESQTVSFSNLGLDVDSNNAQTTATQLLNNSKEFTMDTRLTATAPDGTHQEIKYSSGSESQTVSFSNLGLDVDSNNAQTTATQLLNNSKEFTMDTRLTATAPDGTHQEIKYSSGSEPQTVSFSNLGLEMDSIDAERTATELFNNSKGFTVDTRLTATAPDGAHQEIKYSSGSESQTVSFSNLGLDVDSNNAQTTATQLLNNSKDFTVNPTLAINSHNTATEESGYQFHDSPQTVGFSRLDLEVDTSDAPKMTATLLGNPQDFFVPETRELTMTGENGVQQSLQYRVGYDTTLNFDDFGIQLDIEGSADPATPATDSYNPYSDGLDGTQIEIAPNRDLQVGADNDVNHQLKLGITSVTANGLEIEDESVVDIDQARAAITSLDMAIDVVNQERSYLASEQNRLAFTMSNLSSNIQSIESSRSSIQDTDFAADAADLAKNQILAQSATAMLAQASALPQNILSLIAA